MLRGALLAGLLMTAPPGATPPPGGHGPVSGDLTGRWEVRFRGLPAGFPARLVLRLEEHQTRVAGELLEPPGPAFVTGKMLGRLYLIEVRPVPVGDATASYRFEASLDPTSDEGLGTVRASLASRGAEREAAGTLALHRLEDAPLTPERPPAAD